MSDKPKPSSAEFVGRIAATVVALTFLFFFGGGGWNALDKYLQRRTSHDKLTTVRYDGEWSLGEYRECMSANLREEDVKPELICISSSLDPLPIPIGRLFNVSFSGGDLTYDEEKPQGEIHHWLCSRNNDEVTFSCSAKPSERQPSAEQPPNPAEERQLTPDELESLRKRNECEQRFYDNKIYKVDGMSVRAACRQNPERRPGSVSKKRYIFNGN